MWGTGSGQEDSARRCHPSYSGCLDPVARDYDCKGSTSFPDGPRYTGEVRVSGSDPFDLDRDDDGIGCESGDEGSGSF